jgi:hypothetical protein
MLQGMHPDAAGRCSSQIDGGHYRLGPRFGPARVGYVHQLKPVLIGQVNRTLAHHQRFHSRTA